MIGLDCTWGTWSILEKEYMYFYRKLAINISIDIVIN